MTAALQDGYTDTTDNSNAWKYRFRVHQMLRRPVADERALPAPICVFLQDEPSLKIYPRIRFSKELPSIRFMRRTTRLLLAISSRR